MQPEQIPEQEQTENVSGCSSCGSSFVEADSPSRLCSDCRHKYIRFPIPLWIKLFGAGIGLVVVFSLFKLPKQLSLGVTLERGKTAIQEKRYITAQKYLQEFTGKVPSSEEGHAYLLIASFYNSNYVTLSDAYAKLEGKEVEDNDLYKRVQSVLDQADDHFPTDSFAALLSQYNQNSYEVPDTAYQNYLRQNEEDIYAALGYASKLLQEGYYRSADSIVQSILKYDEEYLPALSLIAGMKRQQDSFDVSLRYCDRMLTIHRESPDALCSKARTLLKMKRDKEALELATRAYGYNANESYVQSTLALAYHYTNHAKERDELLRTALATDTTTNGYAQHAANVINGKEQYR